MKKLLALIAILALAACETAPAGFTPAPLDFAGKQPIRINVAEVRIVDNFQSSSTPPNVENTFPLPPAAAIKIWAKQRLYATGTSGVLEISIDDASVKEVQLPKTKGLKGVFTDDQDARYDMRIAVTMRLFNGTDAISAASGDVSLQRSRSIHEKATVQDREIMFDQMTKEMIASFDNQATQRLTQYFAAYLR